jgi:hypothetical protein
MMFCLNFPLVENLPRRYSLKGIQAFCISFPGPDKENTIFEVSQAAIAMDKESSTDIEMLSGSLALYLHYLLYFPCFCATIPHDIGTG